MSAIFGKWNLDGGPIEATELERVSEHLASYGPDGQAAYCKDGTAILYHALHTTPDSVLVSQPFLTPSRTAICWDGRLDNRAELLDRLGAASAAHVADVGIVASAWERWGERCLPLLIGDWALSIWEPRDRRLVLARDFMGVRPLYYTVSGREVRWCTVLDALVRCASGSFALQEEYLAGWLLRFPAAHLTPYAGIHAVPPASRVLIHSGRTLVQKYWDFDPDRKVPCRTDREYEEQFLAGLDQSVRRRLRSSAPVLAELSGGVDSSSIVCLADRIIARGDGETPRLDTLSYFDDSEPNWNERPYVAVVECKRGCAGCHIDVPPDGLRLATECGNTASAPGASQLKNAAAEQFRAHLRTNGIRVLLSGVGGDEVLGGVPDPVPELADLLRAGKLRALFVQMTAWALALRRPLFGLLAETLGAFLPVAPTHGTVRSNRPSWIRPNFLDRNLAAPRRFALRGPRPSFQDSLHTLEVLRAQLGCSPFSCRPPYEKRYPYLDRDLLEFLFAVPPEQLLKPNRRRHLMRRSLTGILPEEILNRRRKAYVVRRPTLDLLQQAPTLTERIDAMPEALLQIIDPDALRRALASISQSPDTPLVPLIRTFALDAWLHDLENSGTWNGRIVANGTAHGVRAAVSADRFSPAEDQTTAERR